ncbi:MAG TPA: 23S rRNA (guanosine(2251)-2'-O)-methyltransferase RlmB, partial [Ferruginibacter sp.]|nr:23S rRNA (guanosine(2251)-2'-O)-methyltransferase RlmB [Ferruginibacter sp.]
MKNFRQSRNQRPKKNRLITGATDVIRALKENIQLDRIFILATFNNAVTDQLKKLAAECGVPVNKVP